MAGDEWIECRLADACSSVDYGFTASASAAAVGPRFLRITDLVSGSIDWNSVAYVAADKATAEKYRLNDGDIVLARTGASTGASAYIKEPPPAVFASYLVRLKPKAEFDGRFLAYYLKSDAFQSFIHGVLGDKSAQPNASASTMTQAPLRAPRETEIQRAIGQILGTLDDKIEQNRRINETLEAMARALFKSWFVDFDPVRAKAEGRDPGLPQHIAELFPDSFEGSPFGRVPHGWHTGAWGDLVTLEYGKALSGYNGPDGAFPVYGTNGKIGSCSTALCNHAGIVIGRKGAYRGVHFSASPFFAIDTAFYVEPKVPLDLRWAYYELLRYDLNGMDSGSAIPSTSRGEFYTIPVAAPPYSLQQRFSDLLAPLWSREAQNEQLSRTLTELRDTLLPRLISGALRVEEAERIASECPT
jgi:type I restriction enzyme S subunit